MGQCSHRSHDTVLPVVHSLAADSTSPETDALNLHLLRLVEALTGNRSNETLHGLQLGFEVLHEPSRRPSESRGGLVPRGLQLIQDAFECLFRRSQR